MLECELQSTTRRLKRKVQIEQKLVLLLVVFKSKSSDEIRYLFFGAVWYWTDINIGSGQPQCKSANGFLRGEIISFLALMYHLELYVRKHHHAGYLYIKHRNKVKLRLEPDSALSLKTTTWLHAFAQTNSCAAKCHAGTSWHTLASNLIRLQAVYS